MHKIILEDVDNILEKTDLKSLKNSRILITGATGIIGTYLIACLTNIKDEQNLEIYAWTNSSIPEFSKEIFKGCEIIIGDITEPENFKNLPKFDYIIHAAGYGQPIKFVKDKIKTIKINTSATIQLFNILKDGGRFLFMSSSEVYNGVESCNINENMMGNTNTSHFRSCYIEGKKCGESICHAYAELGYNVKIVRLSLAYGPGTRVDDERVINTFIKNGLTKKHITMLDHGESIRTYCYITDAIEMIFNVFLHGKHVIYNVGGVSRTSIYDMAYTISKLLNVDVILPDLEKPLVGNPAFVGINCDRYMSEFEKNGFTHLKNGLEKTINWYKKLLT